MTPWLKELLGSRSWWHSPRWLALGLALAAGISAAWVAQRHLQTLAFDLQARHHTATRAVVVAAQDLLPGTRLQWEHLAVRQMPERWLPADVLGPDDFPVIEHATLQHPVRRGDPLPWGYLAAPAERFSTQLAAGRRAVTIPVDDINSLAGLLQPGDRIDLYVSFQHRGERVTAPLLQGMRVLATGRQQDGHDSLADVGARFATVTLDASPQEAVRLIAAREQGTISAMLRHGGDLAPSGDELRGSLAEWLGLERPELPVAVRRGVPVVFGDRHPTQIPRLDGEAVAPPVLMMPDGAPPRPTLLAGPDEVAPLPGMAWETRP
ncbi:MAG: Flp pilus assembly protein CpaB [Pigmentiphaga sp.]|nr:Flp pilus assembly protein CpaB [Pigmentiphaga sp.]